MGYDLTIDMSGADKVAVALSNAQKTLGENTRPVMQKAAETIAGGAASRAVQHPSGLWRGRNGRSLSPKYNTKAKGAYLYKVETPGTDAGRAEAISEFARLAVTPQGASMIRALDNAYGRGGGSGGGRILWASADEIADGIISDIEAATDKAAKEIEKQMGEA